jgi:hypothetical protein
MTRDHHAMLHYFPITREAAWRRYLETVRSATDETYGEAEETAWAELQVTLSRLQEQPAGAA